MTEKDWKGVTGTSGSQPPTDQNQNQNQPVYQAQQQYYGTFQGIPQHNNNINNNQSPLLPPVVGIPQPVPPTYHPYYYVHGYQSVPGYAIAEGRPFREPRLQCCGIGLGWFLFVSGFFLAAIPWYVGALILMCVRVDYREKPGLVACMVASILAMIAVLCGVTKGTDSW